VLGKAGIMSKRSKEKPTVSESESSEEEEEVIVYTTVCLNSILQSYSYLTLICLSFQVKPKKSKKSDKSSASSGSKKSSRSPKDDEFGVFEVVE